MEKNYTQIEIEKEYQKILNYYKSLYSPSQKPKVFLLGGQPGSGKSALEHMINIKENYIFISGDNYREYHPRFKKLNLEYGKESSKYTQKWSSEITEKLIKELRKEKYNLIIEGTLRTPELPLKEATAFKKEGYEVELNVVVVKPEKSRLGTLERYEKMLKMNKTPRMTPKEHHDLVVENIANNLDIIYNSNFFDEIKLFNRENNLLYSLKETPLINPKNILEKEFYRDWKDEEIKDFKIRWEKLIKIMEDRKANLKEIDLLKLEKNSTIEKVLKIEKFREAPIKKKIKNKNKEFER